MKHIVGVADMKISSNPDDVIITYALGSCLAVTLHDPVASVGGMVHIMLPLSAADPKRAAENPLMFVDTAVPMLFIQCYKAGAQKQRVTVKVAGGACASGNEENDHFQIGKRNMIILRKLLWKNGVMLDSYDVGGSLSRTMSLHIGTGDVLLKTNGVVSKL